MFVGGSMWRITQSWQQRVHEGDISGLGVGKAGICTSTLWHTKRFTVPLARSRFGSRASGTSMFASRAAWLRAPGLASSWAAFRRLWCMNWGWRSLPSCSWATAHALPKQTDNEKRMVPYKAGG